ncbi:SusC/RagA family TonB-linked outer membrane protein [Myroides albus]|uniref:SusC/RagA family TonB-linked outer membrane protein n=1 Tax=Myroides albus TaxID=2562892 RepID=A0A6I3LMB8_9FLAO|nr:SusC/RagA family TonB-linked outer membrane protein [Myroides albus]MTG98646.1 SusC/RagA family TonB-linked outer membrane protein [Myroides albus]UVD79209.1 SusC/RagA family TonB-linked outer membrane protein [Myroides albus]
MKRILRGFLVVCSIYLSGGVMVAQVRTVTGKVIAASDGLPLPGTTVIIKGTNTAVQTDIDGQYSLKVNDGNAVLVYEFMGFATLEKKVNAQQVINVSLLDDSKLMDEVVINTGYQTLSKRKEAGAVSRIEAKDLKVDGVTDVSRMIEGKVAGVTVQNPSGVFGAAPKITIRGNSSIMGDTKPLWVIDGVVQEDIINVSFEQLASGNSESVLSSAISGLNAEDVLSIDILKDASATAIYGSRAMNGVIVVTTKSGRKETPMSITYAMENTLRPIPMYSQYDLMNSQQNMMVYNELEQKGHLDYAQMLYGRNGGVYNMMYRALNEYDAVNSKFALSNQDHIRAGYLQTYEKANTNWFKELFRPSITQNHSLSFNGGGKNSAYYASLGYFADPGWTIADRVHRLTMNLKNTFFVNDKLTISLSGMASVRDQKAPGTYDSEKDVVNGSISRDFDINPFSYALNTSRALRAKNELGEYEYYRSNWAPFNILNELDNNRMDIDVKDIRFQAEAEYKILPNLKYNVNGSARYATTKRVHNVTENSNVIAAYNANENTIERDQNVFLYRDPSRPELPGMPIMTNSGLKRTYTNDMTSFLLRNTLSYDNVFADKHELDVFGGTEMRVVNRSNDYFLAQGVQYENGDVSYPEIDAMRKLLEQGGEYFYFKEERERTLAFFARAAYTYDHRYTLALTGRYDGSNSQGDTGSSRWLPTWTASGKWLISNEAFMQNSLTVSNLALRASYGLTATAGPATNSLAIYRPYVTHRPGSNNMENGINIQDLKNADLTWEKQYEFNVGVDLGLWNNRLQLAVDAYQRNSFDLIDQIRTSGVGGQYIKLGNNADIKTKGIEFGITSTNIKSGDFSWSTTVNGSIFHQEVTSLQNTPRVIDLVSGYGAMEGRPTNALYSYDFTGLNADGMPTFVQAPGVTDVVGGANFQDSVNLEKYLKYEGSIDPNKTLSLSNTFEYKNWSLGFLFVASGGNKIRLNPTYASSYSDIDVFGKSMNDRWLNPGDENFTNVPVIADNTISVKYGNSAVIRAFNAYNYSSERVADGGFVRLKNISLSYEFPDHFKKSMKMTRFSVRFMATNPWLIYADKKLNGEDPEFYRTGGVAMPQTAQYTLTLNVGF